MSARQLRLALTVLAETAVLLAMLVVIPALIVVIAAATDRLPK